MRTDFESKALILGQLWINFKDDDEWIDFMEYNDLGLPLAFAVAEGIIDHTDQLEKYINDTWDAFILSLGIEDVGFERLEDIFQPKSSAADMGVALEKMGIFIDLPKNKKFN